MLPPVATSSRQASMPMSPSSTPQIRNGTPASRVSVSASATPTMRCARNETRLIGCASSRSSEPDASSPATPLVLAKMPTTITMMGAKLK